jgi:predicted Zn-dependent peptidase
VQKYVLSDLDSGQRVITERIPSVRSVALGFWIGAGARDETPSKAGVTHFIEHLLFKGTRSYSAQDIAEIFDGLGGELNAATSREHTVVYVRVADHHVDRALDEDTPHELVHDLMSEAVFGDHPLGRPVIGTAQVISSVGRRALTSYHQTMYRAGNVVVAAAGNLKHDALVARLEKAERKQGKSPARGPKLRTPLVRPPRPSMRFQRKKTEQYHVCMGAPGIARSDRRRFTASLLDAVLGGSASSRLFQEIREKRGMAYSVYTFASQYTDTGLIGFYVGTRAENLADCLEIANEQIGEIAEGKLRKGELERAKENLKGRILLSMESTSNRMSRLGKSLISDTELLSIDRIAAEIDAVTPEAVAELAGVLLAPDRLSASGIGPSEERFRDAVRRITPELPARAAA